MKQEILRLRILRMVVEGALPWYRDQPLAGGDGDGLPCRVCDRLIAVHQVQYEVDDVAQGLLRMHLDCYVAWRRACADVQPDRHVD